MILDIPASVTKSRSSRPLAANFCLWASTESNGDGKFDALDANETLPSRLPVGTAQFGPLLFNT